VRQASIRWQLMTGVAIVQILVAIVATLLVARYEKQRSYAMLEAGLVEHAATITSVIEPPDKPTDTAILHRELLTLPRNDIYVLSDPEGKVIAASGSWRPTEPLPEQSRSFASMRVGEHRYRMLVERNVAMFDDNPEEMTRLPRLTLIYGSRVSEVDEHVAHVTWTAAWIGLAILFASLVSTGWVVRTGLRPLVELAERAAKIDTLNWQFEKTPLNDEPEELAPLSMALTRLVERLRAAFVRERQFSADAAHEMKTAIAIVKSTLQLALERENTTATYRSGIERALEDTERMQGLAVGMLQLAKIEGFAEPMNNSSNVVDAVAEIREVERLLAPLLADGKIALHMHAQESPVSVKITTDSFRTVVSNLIENAIHYSADEATIDITVETRSKICILTIADTGCGIQAEALPHIFERFYRGDSSRSRGSGGAGLGLSIVRAIVQRAGGVVTAASRPGCGSVFTVQLPAS
jgi:signal transduction histidine kinase